MNTIPLDKLEQQVQKAFEEYNYSEHSLRKMLIIARKLISRHEERGEKNLVDSIIAEFLGDQERKYKEGEIGRPMLLSYKKCARYLSQIHTTGTMIPKRNMSISPLSEPFEQTLTDLSCNTKLSLRSVKRLLEHIRSFFRWLSSCGHTDLTSIDEETIRQYLVFCAKTLAGNTLRSRRNALKTLMLFISENGTLSESMNRLFFFRIPKEKRIQPYIPQDEIAAVLNVINRKTALGKRDYAIILLAAVTGLRGIDIVELTLGSVIWGVGEIRIVQEKTGKALALPLTSDVGAAMHEYILNVRPQSKSDKVFLSTLAPCGPMSRITLNSNFNKYCKQAGIQTRRSFHSLRRSIATNMVISGVSIITVSQALGHSTIEPTKQYISLASPQLKECALGFDGIQIGGAL